MPLEIIAKAWERRDDLSHLVFSFILQVLKVGEKHLHSQDAAFYHVYIRSFNYTN